MPELAEVEHSRRLWNVAIGAKVKQVEITRPESRVYRGTDTTVLAKALKGSKLIGSEARGKQMLFGFTGCWIGIHLGMAGSIRCEQGARSYQRRKHDYLALTMSNDIVLVYEDTRLFGRIRLHVGAERPDWWTGLPPSVLDPEFTLPAVKEFLQRKRRTSIKAALLMQERFPGVGNWMADEILWRARIYPGTPCEDLTAPQLKKLHQQVQWVSRTAVEIMDENWDYPDDWLFNHRWQKKGNCPRCGIELTRATIGGRTTCWCAHCQPEAAKTVSTSPTPKKPKARPVRRGT